MRGFGTLAAAFVITVLLGGTAAAQPVYNIVDIGVLAGDSSSQGFFVSPNGIATGRSITGSFSSTPLGVTAHLGPSRREFSVILLV